ncbi:MAG: hypothetical protein Q7T96_01645 [Methylobacter sp.]|nr:hypothetical protein [Methylobacter sp.]
MQIIDEPKAIGLHSNITLWLQDNRHLPTEEIIATVKHMLDGAEPMVLLHYATESFILKDLLTQEIEAADELKEAHSELEIARKEIDKASRVTDLINKAIVNLTTDHFKTVSTQRKSANSQRGENFKIVESKLKQHWQKNISPDKKATEVAILLENTDIYKKSKTQPKRAVLERYVRNWQAEQK